MTRKKIAHRDAADLGQMLAAGLRKKARKYRAEARRLREEARRPGLRPEQVQRLRVEAWTASRTGRRRAHRAKILRDLVRTVLADRWPAAGFAAQTIREYANRGEGWKPPAGWTP